MALINSRANRKEDPVRFGIGWAWEQADGIDMLKSEGIIGRGYQICDQEDQEEQYFDVMGEKVMEIVQSERAEVPFRAVTVAL